MALGLPHPRCVELPSVHWKVKCPDLTVYSSNLFPAFRSRQLEGQHSQRTWQCFRENQANRLPRGFVYGLGCLSPSSWLEHGR